MKANKRKGFPDLGSPHKNLLTYDLVSERAKKIAMQALIEEFPVNFFWLDNKGVILGVNDETIKILRLNSADEIVGKHSQDVVTPEAWKNTQTVIRTRKTLIIDETHVHTDGSTIVFLTVKTPILDTKGDLTGIIGIAINVTKQRTFEKLQTEKHIADRTINYLKTIATSIAHELQNPLAGIKSSAEVAQIAVRKATKSHQEEVTAKLVEVPNGKTFPEKMGIFLKRIVSKVNTANAYILMQLANMRADRIDTSDFCHCSISEVVQEALSTYHFEDEQQRALVHFKNEDDFTFYGSQRLTKHVLLNLLSNALHYIIEASKGEVTIWLGSDDKYNYLYFKDTAKGMPPEMAEKVFDQFFSKRKNGTGLGLSLCKMVMDACGGDISCVAEENKFAQFTLRFPKSDLAA